MRIVFYGTPDFAVASLDAIYKAGFEIAAVVTAPDKPAGRGMLLHQSPVKVYAMAHALTVLQPVKLRDPGFIDTLRNLHADLQVVIAFRMMPEVVWNMPPKGTINLHASLLPDYRGAAPINWAIINGETKTGVCTFFLRHEIDTGDILLKREVPVNNETTAGELHDVLMHKGAQLIVESLKQVENGLAAGTPQGAVSAKTAPKISKAHCFIQWDQSAKKINDLIRGMSPYPAAYMMLDGRMLKVYKSHYETTPPVHDPGTVLSDGKTFIKIACADGFVYLDDVQLESKKRMQAADFLRGYPLHT